MSHKIKCAISPKPFLKWAGGKGQLLCAIDRHYPFAACGMSKYVEPFVGGGAVLFDVIAKYSPQKVYINDINCELVNAYEVIRDNCEDLIRLLVNIKKDFLPLDDAARKNYYLRKRARFNELKINRKDNMAGKDNIEKAALLIFLNRTCFNGLYRVNKKGLYNVPMGSYRRPAICDAENIRTVSENLRNVTILCGDYWRMGDYIDAATFVYLDPPYRPLNSTSSFTSYTENAFNDQEQERLAQFVAAMHKKGAKILLSNSDPKNHDANDNFFEKLYANFRIDRVQATRMINSKSEGRGKITELLVTNF